MKKIIFECKYFKVRVRDVVIILGIILLLITILIANNRQEENENKKDDPKIEEITDEDLTQEEKEELIKEKEKIIIEKLNDVCGFTKANINDFNYLLNRVDLCSSNWFYDLDLFAKRIEEQNNILKDKKDKNSKDVYGHQVSWLEEIIKLKDEQSKENIESLEKVFKEYKKYYEKTCTKGNVGE